MKNIEKFSTSLIYELVSELETSLSCDHKLQENLRDEATQEGYTCSDIENSMDELIFILLNEKSSGHEGSRTSSVSVGRTKSATSVGTGIRRGFQSLMHRFGGARGQTFGRVTGGTNDMSKLDPDARAKFTAFFAELESLGYEPFITSGHRMPSYQRDLYDRGTGTMTAQPCRSDHQYGYALDINVNLPPDEEGKVRSARMKSSNNTWKPIVDIAHKHDIDWQGAKDRVHFYIKGKVTSDTKKACKDFYGDIDITSRGAAVAMKNKEEEKPDEIGNILGITV